MPELERELRALAALIELPVEPELGARVREALRTPPRRRRWRALAVGLALVAVAIGAAFAVPDSRSAILRFFGLKGVSVIQVEELPRAPRRPLVFGERVSLAEAERRLGFRPLLPRLGDPLDVRVDPGGGYLIVLYRGPVRLSEFRSDGATITKLTKVSKVGYDVLPVRVKGGRGLWVPGGHLVFELGRQPRMAGSTLLWEQGGRTLRLEGRLTKAKALEIAAGVH
jgi:hypothetical protein